MRQIQNYGDTRQQAFCAYCGSNIATRDHVPPKVFLDTPYPSNLPLVSSCFDCNNHSSIDEEYTACLIERILSGSVEPCEIGREKIKRIIAEKPALASRLARAKQITEQGIIFNAEIDRVHRVILKLARGHASYEINEPQIDMPRNIFAIPRPLFSDEERFLFDNPANSSGTIALWPEVGSRAMQRLLTYAEESYPWIHVQKGRYRYMVDMEDRVTVKIVISEYLYCCVEWD